MHNSLACVDIEWWPASLVWWKQKKKRIVGHAHIEKNMTGRQHSHAVPWSIQIATTAVKHATTASYLWYWHLNPITSKYSTILSMYDTSEFNCITVCGIGVLSGNLENTMWSIAQEIQAFSKVRNSFRTFNDLGNMMTYLYTSTIFVHFKDLHTARECTS